MDEKLALNDLDGLDLLDRAERQLFAQSYRDPSLPLPGAVTILRTASLEVRQKIASFIGASLWTVK
jgi:hypothetical protein